MMLAIITLGCIAPHAQKTRPFLPFSLTSQPPLFFHTPTYKFQLPPLLSLTCSPKLHYLYLYLYPISI